MNVWTLVKRSLGFYWRTNLGVLLAAMVSTAVLSGALVVGDSVRYSLRRMVTARLGGTHFALVAADRFFTTALADALAEELNTTAAPVLQLRGVLSNSDGTKRVNRTQVLGVNESFYKVGAAAVPPGDDGSEAVVLNKPLAARLGIEVGEEIVLRIEKPGLMPRDVPLMPDADLSLAFRLTVRAIADESEFGYFNLQANQVAPLNVYVPIKWLQGKVERPGRANVLLLADNTAETITIERANEAVRKCWRPADAGLQLRQIDRQSMLEIRSSRIFIDPPLAEAAMNVGDEAVGILTYFVNELRLGDRSTPYSVVTAVGRSAGYGKLIPDQMGDDEIVINTWLAEDLGARVGDSIELNYFVLSEMRSLQEARSTFRVRQIAPIDGPAADRELMPDFPGLAGVENCRDWEPGIPIELDKIRKRDEDYWQRYRGTPKAFVTLKAGQAMWANRYGNVTAVRYPLSNELKASLGPDLLSEAEPASVGLFFQPVRAHGIRAGNESTDFGQLFLYLSIFIIAAALVLMGLIFVFGVESRVQQVGILLAVGFAPKSVRRLLLIEGAALAVLGALAGTVAGLFYTRFMIYGLSTIWRAAVSSSAISFYAKPSTLCVGVPAGVAISLISIFLTLRKQVSRPARELLAGNLEWQFFAAGRASKGRIGLWTALVASMGAAGLLVVVASAGGSSAAAGAFFGAGALLLIAGLGASQAFLQSLASGWNRPMASLAGLGLRNTARRSGRSLAVVALLACGVFLVIAVGANRHDPSAEANRPDSGTGGFALFGESSIPILHDLNSDRGRESLKLGDISDFRTVQLRVHDGDDASCFNLNRAQRPRLLGVRPQELQERGAFGFVDVIKDAKKDEGWNLLNSDEGGDIIPAIGDYPTVVWALRKSVGDTLDYTDEKGRSFKLRIVGMIKSSILQGSLIITEDQLVERFPSEDGYRMFLVNVLRDKRETATDELSTALRDFGLELTPAAQRLADFSAVENTYLSIFQLLGGLGLVLGSVGLGLVVLRNVLDRRGELGMLRAVGFNKYTLKKMVVFEHAGLMLGSLVWGLLAALIAVAPALKSPGTQAPYLSLALIIGAIAASGVLWIWMATVFALSGGLLDALRNE
ncbi:MAG: FtsX-like permease family protein [Planctomycetota bacterium]|jgi:putative ABC transport system permease protein